MAFAMALAMTFLKPSSCSPAWCGNSKSGYIGSRKTPRPMRLQQDPGGPRSGQQLAGGNSSKCPKLESNGPRPSVVYTVACYVTCSILGSAVRVSRCAVRCTAVCERKPNQRDGMWVEWTGWCHLFGAAKPLHRTATKEMTNPCLLHLQCHLFSRDGSRTANAVHGEPAQVVHACEPHARSRTTPTTPSWIVPSSSLDVHVDRVDSAERDHMDIER